MAKSKSTTSTTPKVKTVRVQARFDKGDQHLTISLNGTNVSAFVVTGDDPKANRQKGAPVRTASVEAGRAAYDQAVAKAEGSGWTRVRKSYSIDDLIG